MTRAALLLLLLCLYPLAGDAEIITGFVAEATLQNPRNTEGDILALKDGTLLAVW
jgi:hypothetical protein